MIRLEAVSKTYGSGPSAVAALRAIELEIRRGEFVAISGPSGSGKSTLLYILGLLDRPQEGRYLLEGKDVTALPDREVSALRGRRIGFVFQSFHLLPRASALENVMLPLLYAGEPDAAARARAALARVGLSARERHRPGQLSGGEQQRVAIARAIVKRPDLILADEPTGNLDARTGLEILELLSEIRAGGVTLVLVTHEARVAERAERVIELADGRVVADRRTAPGGHP